MTTWLILVVAIIGVGLLSYFHSYDMALGQEPEPETCLDLSITECNEVNEKAKTEQVFLPRCSVSLADGQEITVYRGKETCLHWQNEYGSMTYEQWQKHKDQEFVNSINEARERMGEEFAPSSLIDELRELNEKLDELD